MRTLMLSSHMRPLLRRHPSVFQLSVRTLLIQTSTTPNPHSLKFLPNAPVLGAEAKSGFDFTRGDIELRRSGLARSLFTVEGVNRVFLGKDFISITKQDDLEWEDLKTILFGSIMEYYATGQPIMTDEAIISDTTILEDDDEVVAMIKELLESRIRPAVQEDGGDIYYCGFDPDTGIVKLQLGGSCAGCPSSVVTLKHGVENMLMHYIPEVSGIEEVVNEGEMARDRTSIEAFETFEEKLKAAGVPKQAK